MAIVYGNVEGAEAKECGAPIVTRLAQDRRATLHGVVPYVKITG